MKCTFLSFSCSHISFSRYSMYQWEAIGWVNEKAIGIINEVAIGAIIAPRNQLSCFFISCFTIWVVPSIIIPESSSNFTILIIWSISSFEMNKVNPFPALAASCLLIFLLNLSNTEEVVLVLFHLNYLS